MTIEEVRDQLAGRGKLVSRQTLFAYFRKFRVRPVGARQCPQHYPDNAAAVIAANLGLKPNGHRKPSRR